jgi:hypothetical protein
MNFDAFAALMNLAGYMMLTHIVLSLVLRKMVQWNGPLAMELFAVPNAPIAPDWGFRLLRVKYFLPWRPAPAEMDHESPIARLVFWVTRITGAAVPVLLLAFLGGMVWLGTR